MKVVISGSFNKSLKEILNLKEELQELGIVVLNPKSKKTIENIHDSDFILFEDELNKNPNELEEEYLSSIRNADILIGYISNGYLGETTYNEIIYALSIGKKIYLTDIVQRLYCSNKPQSVPIIMTLETLINNGSIKIGINTLLDDFKEKIM